MRTKKHPAGGDRDRRKHDLNDYKKAHKRMAKELGYGKAIMDLIDIAESECAVDRAMIKGRNAMRE